MLLFTPPLGYPRVKVVSSFEDLIATPFAAGVNAFCWPRTLPEGFGQVVEHLAARDGVNTLDDSALECLPVDAAGRAAVEILREDQRLLRAHGLAPILDCIHGYPRDDDAAIVPTDVYSFHVDSAATETDTWLCTYHGAPSEGLRNDEAQRRVDAPETRAALLELFGGADDDAFVAYLSENCYDLHYAPIPAAQPFSFGVGNLWRIAVEYPGSPVPPCIHRAPATLAGQPPRLLLIS